MNFAAPIQEVWSDYTIEMWVKIPTASGQRDLFTMRPSAAGGTPAIILCSVLDGAPYFFTRQISGGQTAFAQASTRIDDNTWHHLAYTRQGGSLKVYIDGVLGAEANGGFTADIVFTFQGVSEIYEDGTYDELKVWDFARTDFTNQTETLIGDEPGLIAYYPFDDATGLVVQDASTGLNDGALINFISNNDQQWVVSGPFPEILPPSAITSAATDITGSSVTLNGDVTSIGSTAVLERGWVYAVTTINADPEIGGTGVTKVAEGGTSLGVFSQTISLLNPVSSYAFKAYATNAVGTTYGVIDSFTTLKEDQTISFNPFTGQTYGDGDINLGGHSDLSNAGNIY